MVLRPCLGLLCTTTMQSSMIESSHERRNLCAHITHGLCTCNRCLGSSHSKMTVTWQVGQNSLPFLRSARHRLAGIIPCGARVKVPRSAVTTTDWVNSPVSLSRLSSDPLQLSAAHVASPTCEPQHPGRQGGEVHQQTMSLETQDSRLRPLCLCDKSAVVGPCPGSELKNKVGVLPAVFACYQANLANLPLSSNRYRKKTPFRWDGANRSSRRVARECDGKPPFLWAGRRAERYRA